MPRDNPVASGAGEGICESSLTRGITRTIGTKARLSMCAPQRIPRLPGYRRLQRLAMCPGVRRDQVDQWPCTPFRSMPGVFEPAGDINHGGGIFREMADVACDIGGSNRASYTTPADLARVKYAWACVNSPAPVSKANGAINNVLTEQSRISNTMRTPRSLG